MNSLRSFAMCHLLAYSFFGWWVVIRMVFRLLSPALDMIVSSNRLEVVLLVDPVLFKK